MFIWAHTAQTKTFAVHHDSFILHLVTIQATLWHMVEEQYPEYFPDTSDHGFLLYRRPDAGKNGRRASGNKDHRRIVVSPQVSPVLSFQPGQRRDRARDPRRPAVPGRYRYADHDDHYHDHDDFTAYRAFVRPGRGQRRE